MSRTTCLRCDWEGTTSSAACPACGAAPLFVERPREPRPASAADTRRQVAGRDVAHASPDERERSAWKAMTAAAALVIFVFVIAGALPSAGDPPASRATVTDRNAVAVAGAFLDAYGEGDADRAIGALSHDAQISLVIRSVGAEGVEGTTEEFRTYLSLLNAWRYRQDVTSCTVTGRSEDGTDLRCSFEYDFLGSDTLGLGPYAGSSFDLTVRGDEVAFVSKFWAFDRFAREVWDPFGDWVAAVYPNDARRMYDDPDRRGVRLDDGSVRRWRRHVADYLRTQLEQSLIGDLLRAPTTEVLGSPVPRWTQALPARD